MKRFLHFCLFSLLSTVLFTAACKKDPSPGKITIYKTSALGLGPITVYLNNDNIGTIYDSDIESSVSDCESGTIKRTITDFKVYQFKATAPDGSEWKRTLDIREGTCERINLSLSNRTTVPPPPPPPSTTGKLVFWENTATGCAFTTTVTIGGITKQISTFSSSAPQCESAGNATFTLASGSYSYSASCSGTQKNGTATVYANGCTPVQLDWGVIPTSKGKVVFWESSGTGCSVTTNVTIGGVTKQISTFSSSAPQCESAGNATFVLDPGTYSYSASCSGTQKTGTVTVYANGCTPVQLSWVGPPSSKGKVVFWESTGTGCAATTNVTISGVTKQISTFSSSAPQCESAGNATFTLDPGTYSYSASCSGTQKTGTVTVYANGCSPVQLNWTPVGPTTGQATFWVKSDFSCGSITVNIGGTTRTISSYYSSTPDCGAAGCANYTLAPGSYSFTAQCTGRNWSGTINVTAGGCSKMQLTI